MNVSDKSISSSSTPNKPLSIPKDTYENEQCYQEKGLNVQNSKKPTPTKHFMSPTISAASKANPPRKKILTERNDSQDATHLQNTPNLTQKTTRSLDSITISSIEFGDNQENALIDDLSSRPYDPITDYLSPRPKFLRYKPNRRRETFLGMENEVKEGKADDSLKPKKDIDLASSCGSLAANSTEANVEQENEEIDDTDEEFEELDEDRGCWGLRGALKVLFLTCVLVFSTLYTSSMNSPTPSPVVQAVVCVKDGYHLIQDHVFHFVKNLDSEKFREGIELGFVDVDGIKKEERIEDVVDIEEAEIYDELNEVFEEIQSGEIRGVVDDFSEGGAMEIVELEEEEVSDGSDDIDIEKIDVFSDLEIAKAEEFLDQDATDSELQGQEAVEEVFEMPLGTESSGAEAVEKENDEILDSEIGEPADITDESLVTEIESILRMVTGFSVFSSIVILGFHLGKKRNARKDSDTILEPCLDTVITEKCSSHLANKEYKNIEHPVSIVNSKSLMNSLDEDSKHEHESLAPTVELLGEIEVGEMSGTIRSCSRVIESEVGSHSVSMEKKGISIKANSICVHSETAFSETSKMNCHSYTKKKEEMVTTTPLRRSSRLRNRVMSP